jgi:hypothetical protein
MVYIFELHQLDGSFISSRCSRSVEKDVLNPKTRRDSPDRLEDSEETMISK